MSTFEAKREKAREAKETRMWADWVEKTQKEISKDAEEREGGGVFVEGVWTPHPPVNLIPDNDWVGETWGVYFSDYDVDELQVRCLSFRLSRDFPCFAACLLKHLKDNPGKSIQYKEYIPFTAPRHKNLRYALIKQIRDYLGIFLKRRTHPKLMPSAFSQCCPVRQ